MAHKKKVEKKDPNRLVAQNRKARRDYIILEEVEAGIVLMGSEVKSLRAGRVSLNESFASERGGELWLLNAHIEDYPGAARFKHERTRPRKLLLHARQIKKLLGQIKAKGMTLVPLSLYFNKKGIAKVKLALGQGRKEYEKRDVIKKREWEREKGRLLRDKG